MTKEEFLERFERREEEAFSFGDFGEEAAKLEIVLAGYYSSKKYSGRTQWAKAKCRTVARNVLR